MRFRSLGAIVQPPAQISGTQQCSLAEHTALVSGRRLSREGTGCCGTGGCCVANPGASEALGYTAEQLADAPEGANLGLGCGNLQAIARLTTGGDAGNCCSPNEAPVRIRARTP